jgi:hypothetical protein
MITSIITDNGSSADLGTLGSSEGVGQGSSISEKTQAVGSWDRKERLGADNSQRKLTQVRKIVRW